MFVGISDEPLVCSDIVGEDSSSVPSIRSSEVALTSEEPISLNSSDQGISPDIVYENQLLPTSKLGNKKSIHTSNNLH